MLNAIIIFILVGRHKCLCSAIITIIQPYLIFAYNLIGLNDFGTAYFFVNDITLIVHRLDIKIFRGVNGNHTGASRATVPLVGISICFSDNLTITKVAVISCTYQQVAMWLLRRHTPEVAISPGDRTFFVAHIAIICRSEFFGFIKSFRCLECFDAIIFIIHIHLQDIHIQWICRNTESVMVYSRTNILTFNNINMIIHIIDKNGINLSRCHEPHSEEHHREYTFSHIW